MGVREYHLVFLCDEWKSMSSYALCGMTSNFTILKRKLAMLLKNKVIEGDVEKIRDAETVDELNNCLTYVFIQPVYNGEFETNGSYL